MPTDIPLRQKAAVLTSQKAGPKIQIDADYVVPALQRGELLVKNSLCGVNTADTLYLGGFKTVSPPAVLGFEAVGTVAALGPGTFTSGFKLGDTVVWVYKEGYAEYTAVPVGNIFKVPKNVSEKDAIAVLLYGLTALALSRQAYSIAKGEWVLIHGASGNVGLLMVQIAKATGAKVIGTVHRLQNMDLIKTLGADAVFAYDATDKYDWIQKVKDLTKDEGVSVIYDFVGKKTWQGNLDAVKTSGTIIFCGDISGQVPALPLQ